MFIKKDLYGDVNVVIQNIGGSRHAVQEAGSFCVLSAIYDDLTEHNMELFRVFAGSDSMEPGESIADTKYWRIPQPIEHIVWVKLVLRVVANGVNWESSCLIRVEQEPQNFLVPNDVPEGVI